MNIWTRSDVHGYTAAKEIHVFRPDWTPKCECSSQNWPVLWITLAQPLSRFRFELTIDIASNQLHHTPQEAQECERPFLDRRCV